MKQRNRSSSSYRLAAYSRAHEIAAPQILAPLLEVLRHPIFRLLLEESSVGVMSPQFLHLTDYVARVDVVENAHKLPEVDVCHPLVAANHNHVFIVGALRWPAEIRRAGHNNRVVS